MKEYKDILYIEEQKDIFQIELQNLLKKEEYVIQMRNKTYKHKNEKIYIFKILDQENIFQKYEDIFMFKI